MGFITISGESVIAQKQAANAALTITDFVLANIPGLGAEPADRIPALPTSGQIVDVRTFTKKGYLSANQVVYSITMDTNVGDYSFNWIGLRDVDGNVIAVSYIPVIEKRKTNGSVQGNNITRSFLVQYSGIAATTAINVPAETWQIDFTARLWGIDERERLANYDLYGHDYCFDTGFAVSLQSGNNYDIAPGTAYVGGIRSKLTAISHVTAAAKPTSVWMDVSLQGDVSDVVAVITFAVNAAAQSDYTDSLGFKHYLAKLADIAANGTVTDRRNKTGLIDAKIAAHAAAADPHSQYLTKTEADGFYDSLGIAAADVAAHLGNTDPHPQYTTEDEVNAKIIAATTSPSIMYFMGQF
ncbi:MAG: phage tail-collar fiber domain-containing protein [Methylobacter sp.]